MAFFFFFLFRSAPTTQTQQGQSKKLDVNSLTSAEESDACPQVWEIFAKDLMSQPPRSPDKDFIISLPGEIKPQTRGTEIVVLLILLAVTLGVTGKLGMTITEVDHEIVIKTCHSSFSPVLSLRL